MTPTVTVGANVTQNSGKDFSTDDRKRYFSADIWATWDAKTSFRRPIQGRALILREAANQRWEGMVLAAHKAGVPMILGTDCGVNNNFTMPGFSIHQELQALVRIGLTPAEALRTATVNAAKWRGVADSEGSIERGRVADLVLLRSNPLEVIRHTEEVDAVIQAGRYYSRSALDGMLAKAAVR